MRDRVAVEARFMHAVGVDGVHRLAAAVVAVDDTLAHEAVEGLRQAAAWGGVHI